MVTAPHTDRGDLLKAKRLRDAFRRQRSPRAHHKGRQGDMLGLGGAGKGFLLPAASDAEGLFPHS